MVWSVHLTYFLAGTTVLLLWKFSYQKKEHTSRQHRYYSTLNYLVHDHGLYLCLLRNYLTQNEGFYFFLTISLPLLLNYLKNHIISRFQNRENHVKTWNKLSDGGQQVVSLPSPPAPLCLRRYFHLLFYRYRRGIVFTCSQNYHYYVCFNKLHLNTEIQDPSFTKTNLKYFILSTSCHLHIDQVFKTINNIDLLWTFIRFLRP